MVEDEPQAPIAEKHTKSRWEHLHPCTVVDCTVDFYASLRPYSAIQTLRCICFVLVNLKNQIVTAEFLFTYTYLDYEV